MVGFARLGGRPGSREPASCAPAARHPRALKSRSSCASATRSRPARHVRGVPAPPGTDQSVTGSSSRRSSSTRTARRRSRSSRDHAEATAALRRHSSKHVRATGTRWPTAEVAVIGPEGRGRDRLQEEIAGSPDRPPRSAEGGEYRERSRTPYSPREGYLDDVIGPRRRGEADLGAHSSRRARTTRRKARQQPAIALMLDRLREIAGLYKRELVE